MDDLLSEFLTETFESLDIVDVELVKFEQEPNNEEILGNIFRLVHTIKGTCGFLGLPRLEALAHAGETLMGNFRDGIPVTKDAVTLILASIDRIKEILAELEANEAEPDGSDADLIDQLHAMAEGRSVHSTEEEGTMPPEKTKADKGETESKAAAPAPAEAADEPKSENWDPALGRELRPGEVSMADLEAAFQNTEGPESSSEGDTAKPSEEKVEAQGDQTIQKNESSVANQSIRVNVNTLEQLMTQVSELVLTRNQLMEMVRRLDDSEFKVPLQRLSTITGELQEGVMNTRMQPIGNAWQKLPRIIRDLSNELNKKINLEMIGAETELDRQVLEMIRDPLTHMVRNSADHGLESGADRLAAGKTEIGDVILRAYHEGGHIIIEIEDDGQGLPLAKIKQKVIDAGLSNEAELEKMSEQNIYRFIFEPGLSTAEKVTSVSGRGVGMDVVRTNIEQIGGSVDVKSIAGRGTIFTIKIPLTLAIVSGLIVEAAGDKFAIPQISVLELVRAKDDAENRIEKINGAPVLRLRNSLLPLVYLTDLINSAPNKSRAKVVESADKGAPESTADGQKEGAATTESEDFVVVCQVGSQTVGIVVDNVFDTEEIVVKPVSHALKDITLFSGNTILGDGSVIMIVDPNGVAQTISRDIEEHTKKLEEQSEVAERTGETTSLLIFRAGSQEPKAVPLELITRLEEIENERFESADGNTVVQYRGSLIPVVHINDTAPVGQAEGRQPVLVFSNEGRTIGIAVDEIVDVVDSVLNVELITDRPGMLGAAVIRDESTDIIDVSHYIVRANDGISHRSDIVREGQRQFNVLLVDDSPFFLSMIKPLLQVAGYEVTVAESADEALRFRADGKSFDLIISDLEMPGMSGSEFAQALKKDADWNAIPILGMSSRSEDLESAIRAGQDETFDGLVGKYDRRSLMDAIKMTLGKIGEAA